MIFIDDLMRKVLFIFCLTRCKIRFSTAVTQESFLLIGFAINYGSLEEDNSFNFNVGYFGNRMVSTPYITAKLLLPTIGQPQ